MSEWDEGQQEKPGKQKTVSSGKWDAGMTVAALISTAAASFLVSYLTRDIATRPIWLLAICFAAPVAALMLAVFLKEKASSSMTPSSSRGAQFALAISSVIVAALVGCFCQATNQEAKGTETVKVADGWSDLLIILDKSGSMNENNRDVSATKAVVELLDEMDDSAQVAMLIDVGWDPEYYPVPIEQRRLDFGFLSERRQQLIAMAKSEMGATSHFRSALETACEMLDQYHPAEGETTEPTVIYISDGNDVYKDFKASDYADSFTSRNIKVNYLYVSPENSQEMEQLAKLTGGSSIDATQPDKLKDQLQQVTQRPVYEIVYKDALRNIDESDTAKTVTGILIILLGILIGVALTIMFSLQGQRRLQTFLSPAMAVLAFLLLAFGKSIISTPWVREAVAFSMLGVVLMRSNRVDGQTKKEKKEKPVSTAGEASADDAW